MSAGSSTGSSAELKAALKRGATAYGMSPNNSAAESCDQEEHQILTLTPDLAKLVPKNGASADDDQVFMKNRAIIKYFKLDKTFKAAVEHGNATDPLYSKVSCPLPEDFDFSDDSGSDDEISEAELKMYRNVTKQEYRGRKARMRYQRESVHIVKRSRILDYLNPSFTKRVSFDTVNKVTDKQDADLFQEAIRMDLMDDGGMGFRHGSVDPQDYTRGRRSGASYAASASISPSRDLSPAFERPRARYHSPHRLVYGHNKIVDVDSFVVTRVHRGFEALYDERQLQSAVLPGRTILVYISGRKHTWVALDWLFKCFAEKGDTIIIVAAVNPTHALFRQSFAKTKEHVRDRVRKKEKEAEHRSSPQHVKQVTASIMKYCLAIADPDLVVKISVELTVGGTRKVLQDMYDLYKPTLIVTSAKRRMETFPAVAWRSSKIGDKLVSTFMVPVILVPAANMDLFEFSLFAQLKLKYQSVKGIQWGKKQDFQRTKLDSATLRDMMNALKVGTKKTSDMLNVELDEQHEENRIDKFIMEHDDDADASDNSSIESMTSDDSSSLSRTMSGGSSIYHLRKACEKIENKLELQLQLEDPTSRDYFKNLLTSVSDASREVGIQMATIERENGAGASLIRTITGAPTTVKYRSLLDVTDDPSETSSAKSSVKVPKINFADDTSPIRPTKSSLKFDINTPGKERARRENARKSFSGAGSSKGSDHRPELHTAISSPEINGVGDKAADQVKDKIRESRLKKFLRFYRK